MSIQLRDYQTLGIENGIEHLYAKNYGGTIIHFATGLGKSLTAAEFIHRNYDLNKQRILFAVHTSDLIIQAYYDFLDVHPEWQKSAYTPFGRIGMGMVMGNKFNQPDARIVIGTPQTLSSKEGTTNRLEEVLKYGEIDLLIIDEAHYAASQSYIHLAKRLRQSNPQTKRLGLTATPMRTDGLTLRQPLDSDHKEYGVMFDSICISRNIRWGIDNHYLCPIRPPLLVETNVDIGKGTNNLEERSRTIDVSNWAQLVVDSYIEHGEDRIGVYYLPSVEHSKQVCEEFNNRGIAAAHVDGSELLLPDGTLLKGKAAFERRRDVYVQLACGDIRIVTNYNVLSHGWNVPRIDLVGLASPTESAVAVTQRIGRGTRLHPDKRDLLVLDYALKDIPLMMSGTLLGFTWDEKRKEMIEDPEAVVEPLSDGLNLRDMRDKNELVDGNGVVVRVGNLFRQKSEAWYNGDGAMSLSLNEDDTLIITMPNYTLASNLQLGLENGKAFLIDNPEHEGAQGFYRNLKSAYTLSSQYCLWLVRKTYDIMGTPIAAVYEDRHIAAADSVELVFDYTVPIIERLQAPHIANKRKQWRKQSPTDKQMAMLKKWGLYSLSKGEAAQLITHHLAIMPVTKIMSSILQGAGRYGQQ